ncbi:MAG: TonB-dependent receptor [Burkholderiaceae bacterium]
MKNHLDLKSAAAVCRESAAVVIALSFVGNAAGQAEPQDAITSFERVIISGSRTGSSSAEVGSTVSVITGTELEQRQIRFVSDALRAVPGIAVSRQGPVGTVTQVRIRGAEANHTVVLVDGVKINDPFTSEVDFAHLLTAQIDRIEILRGPQSVLYGSEAIGGVISIFTQRGDPGTQVDASAEVGSFSTRSGSAALRGAAGNFNYAISTNAFWTDGTNASRFGSEDDGYRIETYLARARWAPSDTASLDGSLRYRDSRSRFDPQDFNFPPGPTFGLVVDGDRRSSGDQFDASLRGRLTTGAIEHQLGFARTRTETDTFADGSFSSGFAGSRTRFDYEGTWRFDASWPQALTLAAEHESQRFESRGATPQSAESQMRNNDKTGLAAEYQLRLPTQTALTLSARRDRHQLFDDATTYRVTVAQRLGTRIKLRTSYGTGIANPTFFELFGFIAGTFDPNSALKPEKSRGFDIGADIAIADSGLLSFTYFNTDLRDEIAGTFGATTFRSSVTNLAGQSKRRGVEIEAHYAASSQFAVGMTYSYTDSKQPDGQSEVRRPRHIGSATITYTLPAAPASITLGVDHNGRQEDLDFRSFSAARVTLRDYTLVRLAASYAVTRNLTLTARVENLLDQDYEEVFSYRPSGRAYYAGVQARF